VRNLTIVIPVRQMAGKLEQLEISISEALREEVKVIVVHDKVDELTDEELQQIMVRQKNPNLDLITGQFNSPGVARNAGMQRVKTKWVVFWDADDFPIVENLLNLYEIVVKSDSEIGVGGFQEIDFLNAQTPGNAPNTKQELNSIASSPGIWRMIFQSNLMHENPFTDLLLAEDQILLSDIRFATREIIFCNFPVYKYVKGNPDSLTGRNRKIADLERSIFRILDCNRHEPDIRQLEFNWIMVAKQSFSLLKFGSLRQKFIGAWTLMRFFLQCPKAAQKHILIGFFRQGAHRD
jgi:glycosyltransferase involved in cell wall biosynthesis